MKQIKITLLRTLLLLALALPTAGMANNGFYIGFNAGQAYFKDASEGMNSLAEILTANCGTCSYHLDMSNRALGYQGFAGYSFNKYFAFEGGYADFGKATGMATGPYIPGFPFTPSNSGTVHSEMKANGVTFDAILGYPLTERFLIFGKIGVIAAHRTSSFVKMGTIGNSSSTVSGNSAESSYGFGVTYTLTNNWALRGVWQQFHNIPAAGSVNFLSLGMTYSFN